MASAFNISSQRPREWRRRVSIQARVRSGSDWSDGRILNISSRGMMLHYSRPLSVGSSIEIRQDGRKVPATVVWRKGNCAGLACDQPIEMIEWVAASSDRGDVARPANAERRRERRDIGPTEDDWRLLGSRLQYIAVTGFSAALALTAAGLAMAALLRPLATAAKVLG